MNFQAWAVDVGVRAVKTAAQTAVALLIGNTSGILAVDWANIGSLAGMAAVVCILQNLTTLNITPATVEPAAAKKRVVYAPMSVTPPAQPRTIHEPPAADPTPLAAIFDAALASGTPVTVNPGATITTSTPLMDPSPPQLPPTG
jgi:hypothetical protein